MADERTEKATPKRKTDSRKKGQVSKSQDLSMSVTLAAGFTVLYVYMPYMFERLKSIAVGIFSDLRPGTVVNGNFEAFLTYYIGSAISILCPVMLSIAAAGIAVNYIQVGPLFTTKPITPDFSKLGPVKILKGFQKFFQIKSVVELLKSVAKGSIIGFVGYSVLKKRELELVRLLGGDISEMLIVIGSVILEIFVQICIILFILGVIDKKYQDYEYEKSIKMTKQEIKDERKNADGDPKMKSKLRSLQMQFSSQRMMSSVPSADVIVTNPTHYAVALRYDTSVAPTPQVVAKGVDFVAFKIREVAQNNNIPVIENKPLARTLYKLVPVEGLVPAELYVAVAEVLAYVYKSGNNRKPV